MSRAMNWHRPTAVPPYAGTNSRFRSSAKQTFEALSFYLDNPERNDAGNFVVIPGRWKSMSEAELHARRVFHRKRDCAQHVSHFDRASGDRWVRVRNETVEMFDLKSCEVCSSHIRL